MWDNTKCTKATATTSLASSAIIVGVCWGASLRMKMEDFIALGALRVTMPTSVQCVAKG